MSRESLNRVLFLLASTGMTAIEFEQLMDEFQFRDVVDLSNQFQQARAAIRSSLGRGSKNDTRDINAVSSDVAKRDILNLLRESGLTQREATRRMVSALNEQGVRSVRALREKEGFVRWLDSMAQSVDPLTMLNAAVTAFQSENAVTSDRWRLPKK